MFSSNRLTSCLAYYMVCLASLLIIGAFAVPASSVISGQYEFDSSRNNNYEC